jgi:hypothetical protein
MLNSHGLTRYLMELGLLRSDAWVSRTHACHMLIISIQANDASRLCINRHTSFCTWNTACNLFTNRSLNKPLNDPVGDTH